MKQIAVLYSGGSDSTAAVILMVEKFDKIHLLTYKHSGLSFIENSRLNVEGLRIKYGRNKFIHKIFDVDKLFRKVSFIRYGVTFKNYGFMALSTCGCCKLAMHIRTLIYCLQNGILAVADGASKCMKHFPAQMPGVIAELRKMYNRYDIEYRNPVFDYEYPEEEIDWLHRLSSEMPGFAPREAGSKTAKNTVSSLLFKEGFYATDNVKGAKINQKAQARCFQFILFSIFLHWYFLPKYGEDKYRQITERFFKERVEYFSVLVKEYVQQRKGSKLYACIR